MEGTRPPHPTSRSGQTVSLLRHLTPSVLPELTAGALGPQERCPHLRGMPSDPLGASRKYERFHLYLFFLQNKEINLCSNLKYRWTLAHRYTHVLRVHEPLTEACN